MEEELYICRCEKCGEPLDDGKTSWDGYRSFWGVRAILGNTPGITKVTGEFDIFAGKSILQFEESYDRTKEKVFLLCHDCRDKVMDFITSGEIISPGKD